ncbi:MAG: GntR family transcriptional regulator [Proteobacteria bacterium]|nr:GntR family transcriptional regulator [Pseudomonadota bacterium]
MAGSAKAGLICDAAPPKSTLPRYRVICDDLKNRIARGEFSIDTRLPSEKDLMVRYCASRVTVRHALQRLGEENLIRSQKGKGHFVTYPKTVQNLGRLLGLGESLSESGVTVSSKVLKLQEVPSPPVVAKALDIKTGQPVTCLQRLRHINGRPMSYDTSYFPIDVGRCLSHYDLQRQDVFVLIEDHLGLELSVADLVIKVETADLSLAEILGIERGEAIILIERLTMDVKGRPVDFEYLHGRRDAFQFRIRVPRW